MRRWALFLSFFSLITLAAAKAELQKESQQFTAKAWGQLPVLWEGRFMPLDTSARNILLQLSGKSTFRIEGKKYPAIHWLARTCFDPERSRDDKLFLVENPETLQALGFDEIKRGRYSFAELEESRNQIHSFAVTAAQRPEDEQTLVDREFLKLHHNLKTYLQLTSSFVFALPREELAIEHPDNQKLLNWENKESPPCFLDLLAQGEKLSSVLEHIEKIPQEEWSFAQLEVSRLSLTLFQWAQEYKDLPIPLLPIEAHAGTTWLSPWDALPFAMANRKIMNELHSLKDLLHAYRSNDEAQFTRAVKNFKTQVIQRIGPEKIPPHIGLERAYNRANYFYRAEIFYGLAFLLSFFALLIKRPWVTWALFLLAGSAFALHSIGLLSRMMIMGRPPVTNLYATFLFVAWIIVLIGFFMEWLFRNRLGLFSGSIMGLVLLLVSGKWAQEGDTLGVLVAVLDSNFWLSTHVTSITMGYAGCAFAGLLGHFYLIYTLSQPAFTDRKINLFRALYGTLCFGLTFSFLGTMLGGIWADQSWGRFWGWDPKENGALLIVIWCAVLFHAYRGKMIGPVGLAAGSVLGNIVVLFAWLGTNLLGVGLHSYGFTSGVFRGMLCVMFFELIFVVLAITYYSVVRRTPLLGTITKGD